MKGIAGVFPGVCVALAVWCCLACGPGPALAEEGRVYIFMDEPLEPYVIGELGEVCHEGMSHDIVAEIFSRLGLEFEIRLVPWARALKTVEHGEADGLPMLMRNEEREAYMVFTDMILEERELFYYLPERLGDIQWQEFSDLKDMTFGLVSGYTYGEDFLAALDQYGYEVQYTQASESAFRQLAVGRVDIVLDNEATFMALASENPEWRETISAMDKPVSSIPWHMGISRLSPLTERVEEINDIIADMHGDGSFEAIKARY